MIERMSYILRLQKNVNVHYCDGDEELHHGEIAIIQLIHYTQEEFPDLLEYFDKVAEEESPWIVVFDWPNNHIVVRILNEDMPAEYKAVCHRDMLMSLYESMTRYGELVIEVALDTGDELSTVLTVDMPMEQVYYTSDEQAVLETRWWMSRN